MRSSVVIPSACAWKFVLMRCRSTGTATFCTSSIATLNRPSIAASALPPWIRNCPARGPAPQSTSSCTNFGAVASFGRVARTSDATYLMMCSLTATEPTSFCKLRIARSESTLRHFRPLLPRRRRQNLLLFRRRRVVDLDVEHEPVELRFGQRIRAFLLDRVLRGDREERIRQRVRRLPGRHFALLHRLQQRGLRLRRRAVDFVRQQNVREDRPFDESERPPPVGILFQHARARDVRGHQVGRELNPLELQIENLRQRADDERLRQPGHADQQAMPAREDRREDLLDHRILPDDDLLQLALHEQPMLPKLLQHIAQIARLGRRRGGGVEVDMRIVSGPLSVVSCHSPTHWSNIRGQRTTDH